jgi:hypothetical protein
MATVSITPSSQYLGASYTPGWHFPGRYSSASTTDTYTYTASSTSIVSGSSNAQQNDTSTIDGMGLAIAGGAITGGGSTPYTFGGTVGSLNEKFNDHSLNRAFEVTFSGLNTPLSAVLGNTTSGGKYYISTIFSIADVLSGNDLVQVTNATAFDLRYVSVSLFGYAGNDRLVGSITSDSLNGGAGDDTFVFAPGGNGDTIVDFTPGAGSVDRIDLTAFHLTLGAVLSYAQQVGSNTVISFPAHGDPEFPGERLTLLNVTKTDLHADDFVGLVSGPAKTSFAQPSLWTSAEPLPGQGGWFVGDFNGDGKDDIFRHDSVLGVETLLSNGTAFDAPSNWTPAGNGSDGKWYVGDFNGDGKADIFRYLDGTSGADVFLSDGTSFVYDNSWTPAGFGSDNKWYVGDFNGDGKTDMFRYLDGTSGADMFLSNGTSFVYDQSWTPAGFGSDGTWHVGDFNGDGKDDIFRQLDEFGADVFLSTGAEFVYSGIWTPAGAGSDARWYIGDFNADGTSDLLRHLTDHGADVLI